MMRNFGSSMFISLAVLVLIRSSATNYAQLAEFISLYRPIFSDPSFPVSWSPDSVSGLMRLAREVQRQASMNGYINAFYLMGLVATVAVPLAACLRRVPSSVR
jgi:DHA2 family multidrug resistance protein